MSPLFKWRPNAEDVARRAIALFLVYQRGDIEESTGSQVQESEQTRERILYWLSLVRLNRELTNWEKGIFDTPLTKLDPQQRIDAFWRGESGGVLVWSLGMCELLPWDVQYGPEHLTLLPVPGTKDEVERFIKLAKLRPDTEVNRARDTAEAWHWRSRTTQIQTQGFKAPPGLTFDEIIRISAEGHYSDGNIPQPIDGDFPAFGKPYRNLGDTEYSIVTSVAMERHYALNWLCGYSKDWDKVPTET